MAKRDAGKADATAARAVRLGTDSGQTPEELDALSVALVEVARALTRSAARAAGPGVGRALTLAQLDVLIAIRRMPDQTVTELAERLQLARNTVSTLVGQLTRAGLLVRADDLLDARVARLSLTPSAAERMAGWRSRRAGAVRLGLAGLSVRDQTVIRKALPALRTLVDAVEREQGAGDVLGADLA